MAGAGSRTLKLSILADIDNLTKNLTSGSKDVEGFGDKISDYGKKAGLAFAAAAAAAGAYALKIGVDGVKAALADEQAQRTLALTLENVTGATSKQIKSVEDYILQTSLAVGVTDDELRPAFSRLVRSTKDSEEAQKLLNLALDISSATGKPLEAIANSLGKAYDGNTNALGKLGLGIDQNILKTKDFNLVYDNLKTSFNGFSEKEALTFQGRMDRLKVSFDETKETIGFALLPILETLFSFISNNLMPVVDKLVKGFSSESGGLTSKIMDFANIVKTVATPIFNGMKSAFDSISDAIENNKENFKSFVEVIRVLAPFIGKVIGGAFSVIGNIAEAVINIISTILGALKPMINAAISAINTVIDGINLVKIGKDIPNIAKISTPDPTAGVSRQSTLVGNSAKDLSGSGGVVLKMPEFTSSGSSGSSSSGGGGSSKVKVADVPLFTGTGDYTKVQTPTVTNNITVNGAIDPEGTARTITNVLNDSYYRGTGGALNLQNSRSME